MRWNSHPPQIAPLFDQLENRAAQCRTTADRKKLAAENSEDGVIVSVPATAPDKISSTVVLRFTGKPDIKVMPISQKPDGAITLPASDARLYGSTIQY